MCTLWNHSFLILINLKQLLDGIKITFNQTITSGSLKAERKLWGKLKCTELVELPLLVNHVQMSFLVELIRQATLCTPSRSTHSSMNRAIVPLLDHNCFFFFDIQSESESHTLLSCSGQSTCSKRRVNGLEEKALDGSCRFDLPTVIECNEIPENKDEIPTPEVADKLFHLQDIADYLMPLDSEIYILLLIERDLGDAHHVLEQRALDLLALHTP